MNRKASQQQPKIGTGQVAAMGRMGLDELSHALKAFPDSIPITPEPGALGEPTPQEVFAEGQGKTPMELYGRDLHTPAQASSYLEQQQAGIHVPAQQQEQQRAP